MQQQQRRRRRRRRLYERRAAVQDIRACLVFEHVLYAWEDETIEGGRGATEISWHAGSTQAARRQHAGRHRRLASTKAAAIEKIT